MRKLARRAAAVSVLMLGSWAALADPIADMNGYWTGNGTIALTNGKTERVKCQVIYRVDGGSQIRQTMRCASADYSINALADLRVKGSQVAWKLGGRTLPGRFGPLSGDELRAFHTGASFSAAMNVTLSACKQSLNISPQGLEVTRVSIALAKERCGE
jgi:hypothetical protein